MRSGAGTGTGMAALQRRTGKSYKPGASPAVRMPWRGGDVGMYGEEKRPRRLPGQEARSGV